MKTDKKILVVSFQSLTANSGAGMARLGYYLSEQLDKRGVLQDFIVYSKGKFTTSFKSSPVSYWSRYILFLLNFLDKKLHFAPYKDVYKRQVLSISITVTAGFLYLRYTTRVYEIGSSILIDEAQDNVAQNVLSKLDPQNDKSKVNLFNEQVVLQSQDMIAKVVDSLALNVRYWARGRIKETEIYKESPIKVVFDTTGLTGGTVELKIKQVMEGQFEVTNGGTTDKVLYDTWVRKPYGRCKIMYTNGVGAVSYTHLDVYKRQRT